MRLNTNSARVAMERPRRPQDLARAAKGQLLREVISVFQFFFGLRCYLDELELLDAEKGKSLVFVCHLAVIVILVVCENVAGVTETHSVGLVVVNLLGSNARNDARLSKAAEMQNTEKIDEADAVNGSCEPAPAESEQAEVPTMTVRLELKTCLVAKLT